MLIYGFIMKKYSDVIFDLFDTLILFRPELLPKIEVNGRESFSTGKDVYRIFTRYFKNYGFNEFYDHFVRSYQKFQELKNADNREYPTRKRFEIMLGGMDVPGYDTDVLQELVVSHMRSLSRSMVFPQGYKAVLSELAKRGYRLSILSNFDCSRTAYDLLKLYKMIHHFDHIFISEDIGWRKPSPRAFEHVTRTLNVRVEDAVYIGDDYERDIIGACRSNIDSILIDPDNRRVSCSPAFASVTRFDQILNVLP